METVLELLKQLPEGISEEAIAESSEGSLKKCYDNVPGAIAGAFVWDRSAKGHDYWQEIYEQECEKLGILPWSPES